MRRSTFLNLDFKLLYAPYNSRHAFNFTHSTAFIFCKVKQIFFLHLCQKKYSLYARLNLRKAIILVFTSAYTGVTI